MPDPVRIIPPEYTGVFAQPWSWRKLGRVFRTFGPAAIVASVAIGAGETIVVVRAGAWAGYGLLWLVLLSVIVKGIFVTYLLGRYTAVSGEPISQRLARVPGPRGWLLLTILFLEMAAAGPLWAAVARPCGELLYFLLFDGTQFGAEHSLLISRAITMLFIIAALGFSLVINYDKLEKQQVIICCALVIGTIIGTFLVKPDLWAALKGSLDFGHVPPFPAWAPDSAKAHPALTLATTFGYVGGSVLGYIVYANWISLHGWGLTSHPQIDEIRELAVQVSPRDYLPTEPVLARRVLKSLAPLKWDVGCGAAVLWIVTASFMMAGAAVLYPLAESGKLAASKSDWSLLTDQASIWHNIHPSLIWMYYICVLLALWGTLQAFPEIYSRTTHDFLQSIWPARRWSHRHIHAIILGYVLIASTLVVWSNLKFDTMTHIVAFLTTNLAVAVSMCAALYLNFQLPREYRTRWWMLIGGSLSAAILLVVAAVSGAGVLEEICGIAIR
jgi:Mn2+/Fe2+ NRAMP family transporter